jgi:hypothetical protein
MATGMECRSHALAQSDALQTIFESLRVLQTSVLLSRIMEPNHAQTSIDSLEAIS